MSIIEQQRFAWLPQAAATAARPEPSLQVRPLRYVAEGHPGALPPIHGLRARLQNPASGAFVQNPQSGLLCAQDLPEGRHRVVVTDPERRFLPAAVTLAVGKCFPARPTLESPATPPTSRPATVLLRPAPGRAIPAGMTAVIGTLRDTQGRGIALGMVTVMTVMENRPARIVTWTAEDGSFALWLPGEAHGLDSAAPPAATRSFTLHVPTPTLAAALAADYLAALPVDLDGSSAATQPHLFRMTDARLIAPDGSPAPSALGRMPLRPARTLRWDLLVE